MDNDHADTESCTVDFVPKIIDSEEQFDEVYVNRQRCLWFTRTVILNPELINDLFYKLTRYCLTHRVDAYRIHLDRKLGTKIIFKIAKRTNYTDLTLPQIINLIWACMSVCHHFYVRLVPRSGWNAWWRRREFKKGLRAYRKVLSMLLPHLFVTVMHSLISFFNESMIWELDALVTIIIKETARINKNEEDMIDKLLEVADEQADEKNTSAIIRVLYKLIDTSDQTQLKNEIVLKILQCYKNTSNNAHLGNVRACYDVCLRHILKRMKHEEVLETIKIMLEWVGNVPSKVIIEIGGLLEFASSLCDHHKGYSVTITNDVFRRLLELLDSNDVYLNLLSSRIMFLLLERNKNPMLHQTRIYFKDSEINIRVGTYSHSDRRFLQHFHNEFHAAFLSAVLHHGVNRINLECMFAVVAVMVVEVPCGYTAASAVCLAMAIQEHCLTTNWLLEQQCYRIHSCIMGVMSLVCFVHNANILYEYVDQVMTKRAQHAPSLNPPLKASYRGDFTNMLNPDLYFDDWEARFGLMKCFIRNTMHTTRRDLVDSYTDTKM